MTIIGIIAAMSIPHLISNYKAIELQTRFLKSYSTIQQIAKLMKTDDLAVEDCLFTNTRSYKKMLAYLSEATDCGTGYSMKCANIKKYSGVGSDWLDDGQIRLSDGTMIFFEVFDGKYIFVDINGYKSPNKVGYDVFPFQAIGSEFVPMGAENTDYNEPCNLDIPDRPRKRISCTNRAKNDANYFKIITKEH